MSEITRTLAYRLAYDGARYHGMQVQPNLPTVQGAIEAGLKSIFGKLVRIRFAGRTDTGVHATAQMIAFEVDNKIPVAPLRKLLNRKLGGAARLGTGWEARSDFHPRYNAVGREYTYVLDDSGLPPDPFRHGRVSYIEAGLDWSRAQADSAALLGMHDFRAFCIRPAREPQPMRGIEAITIASRGRYRVITIRGRSFLRGMVRHVVGALLRVARGDRSEGYCADLLAMGEACEKDGSLVPAESAGLYLSGVEYPAGLPGPDPQGGERDPSQDFAWLA